MPTKFEKALSQKELNIVDFVRKLRNADYSKWESTQRLPEGMARVDLDARPMGKHDMICKQYDYARVPLKSLDHPDIGVFIQMQDLQNIQKFLSRNKKVSKANMMKDILIKSKLV